MFRRIGIGLLVLLGLVVLVVAVVLGEAHVEIRSIDPALPSVDEVASLPVDPNGPRGVRWIDTASQGDMGHHAFLVEWPDGRILMIDAGMDRESALEFGAFIELVLGGPPIAPLGSVAEQMGPEVERVAGIGFTHLHTDHTDGLTSLCASTRSELALVQTSFQAERSNYGTSPGRDTLLEAPCVNPLRLADAPLRPVPDFPGVFAIAAGGHTPGSTVWVVRAPDRIWVLAGDVSNVFQNLLDNRPKSAVYSLLIVPEAPRRLEKLRLWLAELHARELRVVVSHDHPALVQSGMARWAAE